MNAAKFAPCRLTQSPLIRRIILVVLGCQALTSIAASTSIATWGNNNNLQTQVPPSATNVVAVSGGTIHSLALRSDGTVVGWGDNFFGQSGALGLSNVMAISAGDIFSLALLSNGTVTVRGTLPPAPNDLTNVTAIAAGWRHGLALKRDGTVVSWGDTNSVPAGLSNVVAIAAGDGNSLALRSNGTLTAWGNPAFGKTIVPPGLSNFVAIAAGKDHCLALRQNGNLVAWGRNEDLQANVPPNLSNVVAISAGAFHSLALHARGTNAAWGNNVYNQSFAPGLAGFQQISAGGYHNLGLVSEPSPYITLQPRSQAIPYDKDATFVVLAAGTHPMTYQWRKNGTNIVGKTSNILLLPNIQTNDAAVYSVAISNSVGSVISANATLTPFVNPPLILNQPQNVEDLCGATVSFSVHADGFKTLGYQWQFEGVPIEGATSTNLVVTNITPSQAGGYSVVVTNVAGSITSVVATLTVIVIPPLITLQPQDATALCGAATNFVVAAESINPLTYQWQFEGVPIADATNTSLTFPNVLPDLAGAYSVVIADQCGSITSAVATLTVIVVPPEIVLQPLDTNTICGEDAAFEVVAQSINPMSYQWQFEGVPIPGETNTILSFINVASSQAGGYSVVITDQCAASTSVVAILYVIVEPPFITSSLTNSWLQGLPLNYAITGLHRPSRFDAIHLPLGLTVDTNSGVISGTPLQDGTFYPIISTFNNCSTHSEILTVTIDSAKPMITSALLQTGEEDQNLTYTIEATGFPLSFGAQQLPEGLYLDPTNGVISGQPIYAGEYDTTISASNIWGTGSTNLHLSITNKPITGLSIANVTYTYSSPYLLDFEFSLRDNDDPNLGNAVVVAPHLLTAVAFEDDRMNSPSETGVRIARGSTKLLKANLVLDFTESLASLVYYPDSDNDGISDPIEQMVEGAQTFVDQQSATAQIGVFEFHREDFSPQQVVPLTTDKKLLNESIAGIWTNYVNGFPASSRCWDALMMAITNLGPANPDEQHYVVFISDGVDESSLTSVTNVITTATNNGVKIYCIGFGDFIDTNILNGITTETHGRYYSAGNAAELAAQFAQISKDLYGQYILRWATLKRTSAAFQPKFQIFYQDTNAISPPNPVTPGSTNIDNSTMPPTTNIIAAVTNFIIAPYIPTQHTGSVTLGSLRLSADAAVSPTAITLRTAYTPRFIRQIRIHYRANWPCTTSLMSTGSKDILEGWSLTETNDGAGGKWMLLSTANPQSIANSIPFAAFGNLVHFNFQDVINPTNAFSLFEVDTNLASYTGGQRFKIENTNAFVTAYPVLPFQTPVPWLLAYGFGGNLSAAEISDPDGDGVLTWQEYVANTNPTNTMSRFVVSGLSNDIYGRYQITFSTALNRRYRVESSFDLVNWEIVDEDIAGTGADMTILDHRYQPWITEVFYRAVVY